MFAVPNKLLLPMVAKLPKEDAAVVPAEVAAPAPSKVGAAKAPPPNEARLAADN
jgi:hypothetical protein